MPSTNYPNGLSTTTAIHTVNNHIVSTTMTVGSMTVTGNQTLSGTLAAGTVNASGLISATLFTMSTTTTSVFIGERAYLPFSFTSAATTAGLIGVPFNGNIIDCWTTCDTTPRVCSAFTLYTAGSASGTVAVASVALTFATAIGQMVQSAITPVAVTTATAMAFVVTTAGTAANFSGYVVIQRTA